jgi:uncharacterized membrane protein
MNGYYLLKTVHVVSSTVLFGTGLGIAFFKWITDRSGSLPAICVVSERVVWADWLFTLPAIVAQAATGFALARYLNYPLLRGWLAWSIVLFCVAGLCWLPVVWLQLRMRDLAREAERGEASLGTKYRAYAKVWFWLGIPAFASVILIFWLMVTKPNL